ncbi:FMN-binding split barrel-related protein [Penicillium coprophilum]|uniref:FMN-binding split barrel-related protein n=1 Tax=Penicillium coprophilum TaxID=36646 RepID=UPI00238DC909|nr:FMN-binding split barrel-related protein [Penicillium coprophilum]KAJ5177541.1 FMN-binding split barrel-related protein [Penicillium coprophilum]
MSTTSKNPQRAPWRDLLDSQLKQTAGYDFTVATVGYDAQQRPVPRLRTCGCRGFFPELELNSKGQEAMDQQVEGGGNPPIFESDMLSFTTDPRMEKLSQLESSGHAVEAVFWLKDLMTQWRIKGTAYVIGDPSGEDSQEEKTSRTEIRKALRVKGGADSDVAKWTWQNAVTKYFANHSPVARGFFRNPPPGQPKSSTPSQSDLKLGQKVLDLYDPVARANFRVVVIRPEQVERLDLTDQENAKRWNWTFVDGDDGAQWDEIEVWP